MVSTNQQALLLVGPAWDTVQAVGELSSSSRLDGTLHWAGNWSQAIDIVEQHRVQVAVIDVWPASSRQPGTRLQPVPEAMPTTTSAALMLIHMLKPRSKTLVLIQPGDSARRDILSEAGATDVIVRSEDTPLSDQIWAALSRLQTP